LYRSQPEIPLDHPACGMETSIPTKKADKTWESMRGASDPEKRGRDKTRSIIGLREQKGVLKGKDDRGTKMRQEVGGDLPQVKIKKTGTK